MFMQSIRIATVIILGLCAVSSVAQNADGLGVNVPVVGRLIGSGTLFITALDVSNHTTLPMRVDFYLDGQDGTGTSISVDGSIGAAGQIAARGAGGSMRARLDAHFDDFVGALVDAGMLPESVRTNGFIGSALFVFDGNATSGRGAVTARFYNRLGDGFVGVALKGREVTVSEPQRLVAAVLDTRGNTSGAPQMYPNVFINNMGITPNGQGQAGAVDVEISAIANSTGAPIGTPITIRGLAPGRTASVGQILNALQIPATVENTVLVFARVTSGTSAIQGVVSQVDAITRDGAVFEMSRADF
jgi:hypothetical protein